MSDKFAKWEKIRQKGKWNYILKYGVLLYGFLAILVYLVCSIIYDEPFWSGLPIVLIVFVFLGVIEAYFLWEWKDKAYMEYKGLSPAEK